MKVRYQADNDLRKAIVRGAVHYLDPNSVKLCPSGSLKVMAHEPGVTSRESLRKLQPLSGSQQEFVKTFKYR